MRLHVPHGFRTLATAGARGVQSLRPFEADPYAPPAETPPSRSWTDAAPKEAPHSVVRTRRIFNVFLNSPKRCRNCALRMFIMLPALKSRTNLSARGKGNWPARLDTILVVRRIRARLGRKSLRSVSAPILRRARRFP
jgi:hypothetical protein